MRISFLCYYSHICPFHCFSFPFLSDQASISDHSLLNIQNCQWEASWKGLWAARWTLVLAWGPAVDTCAPHWVRPHPPQGAQVTAGGLSSCPTPSINIPLFKLVVWASCLSPDLAIPNLGWDFPVVVILIRPLAQSSWWLCTFPATSVEAALKSVSESPGVSSSSRHFTRSAGHAAHFPGLVTTCTRNTRGSGRGRQLRGLHFLQPSSWSRRILCGSTGH